MNLYDMVKFWQERIPQTEAAAAEAATGEDWQTAETLTMLAQQQIAFLEDLEGLRLFWLTKAAEQPSRAEVIRMLGTAHQGRTWRSQSGPPLTTIYTRRGKTPQVKRTNGRRWKKKRLSMQ